MPIDPNSVKWDAPDPRAIKWDDEKPQKSKSGLDAIGDVIKNNPAVALFAGGARGVKDVIDAGAQGLSYLGGKEEADRVRQMNAQGKAQFEKDYAAYPEATVGRIAGNVVGTAPLISAAGAGAAAAGATNLGKAIASSGFQGGNLATRIAGGGIAGGLSSGAVNPEDAGIGATIGAALPGLGAIVSRLRGTVGNQAAIDAAKAQGFTLPAQDANTGAVANLLSAWGGKIKGEQNASMRNLPVAAEKVAAQLKTTVDDLTPEGLSLIRNKAYQQGYEPIKQMGEMYADKAFLSDINKVLQPLQNKSLPSLNRPDVIEKIQPLAVRRFDPADMIDGVRSLRDLTSRAFASGDKEAGQAYKSAAKALEDVLERNIASSGSDGAAMLQTFKDARKTIAQAYSAEKAAQSGNIAKGLANQLKKGKPLEGEMRAVAQSAQDFPKSFQAIQGVSPYSTLDTSAGGLGAGLNLKLLLAQAVGKPFALSASLNPTLQRLSGAEMPATLKDLITRSTLAGMAQ